MSGEGSRGWEEKGARRYQLQTGSTDSMSLPRALASRLER
jgi:hypothetical protein